MQPVTQMRWWAGDMRCPGVPWPRRTLSRVCVGSAKVKHMDVGNPPQCTQDCAASLHPPIQKRDASHVHLQTTVERCCAYWELRTSSHVLHRELQHRTGALLITAFNTPPTSTHRLPHDANANNHRDWRIPPRAGMQYTAADSPSEGWNTVHSSG